MTTSKQSVTSPRASTILVVDDDVEILTLCAVKLEAHGFSVLKAIGSAEAHRLCADHPAKIDLILVDVMLYPPAVELDTPENVSPRMHGDKLVPILRTQRPLTPIMLMSASSPWKLGGRGMARVLRQYPFLQKPFTGDLLLEKVRAILASRAPVKS